MRWDEMRGGDGIVEIEKNITNIMRSHNAGRRVRECESVKRINSSWEEDGNERCYYIITIMRFFKA